MKKKKKLKESFHDKTIGELEKRLQANNRIILTEHKYHCDGDHEADILVIDSRKRYAYAIEVKTADTTKAVKKAYWQLRADKRYLQKDLKIEKVFCFYVHKLGNNYAIHKIQ